MFCKLALRNVRRSARDYTVYFVTVALGVAMFYAFNAVNDQAVLLDALSADSLRMIGLLNMMMGLLSGAVACVLGFLVVYANRFIIRRRRREFGMYLMLGMSPRRVSGILLCEAVIVGTVSLAVGLAVGIGLSQGLSFATAALMGTTMSKYQFIVSGSAIGFTCLCFLIIFAVSALFDIAYIRRCKLAKLLCAHEASESVRPIRVPLRIAGFVASLAVLGCAYWQLSINGLMQMDEHFTWACALMIVGTFLFFWSVAGFAVAVLARTKSLYFKGIRMFTVRQISSKINTAFASIAVVSIMLFFALTITSTGMGLVQLFVGDLENTTAYDATIMANAASAFETSATGDSEADGESAQLFERYDGNIAACLAERSSSWEELVKGSAQIDYYRTGITYADITSQVSNAAELVKSETLSSINATEIKAISVSQYNAVSALTGRPQLSLREDECAVNNLPQGYDALAQAFVQNSAVLAIGDAQLHFAGNVLHTPMRTSALADVALEIVVPDAVVAAFSQEERPLYSYLNIMYDCDRAQGDALFAQMLSEAFPASGGGKNLEDSYAHSAWPLSNAYTGKEMADQASGMRMVITYLAIYIGFVLLVATAAILAIQQLSETADALGRYRRLHALGCDQRAIFGSLKTQTVTYFLAPLVLATCHTICAVTVLASTLFAELGVNLTGSITLSAGTVIAVYAIYLTTTYLLSKSVVKSSL